MDLTAKTGSSLLSNGGKEVEEEETEEEEEEERNRQTVDGKNRLCADVHLRVTGFGLTMARDALPLGHLVVALLAVVLAAKGDGGHEPTDLAGPVLYLEGKTLAEVVHDDGGLMVHCRLHELEDPSDADDIIRNSGLQVLYPDFDEMLQLINNCTRLEKPLGNSTTAPHSYLEQVSSLWSSWSVWNGIVPGTKWCGVGDIAGTFEELGTQTEVDACCRAHDHCPVKLKAFRAGYGLINLSLYTKSHCDCDKEFYSCLKTTEDTVADVVGNFYFNLMKVQCIREHRPYICIENRTETGGSQRCVKWSADPDSKKMQVTITQLRY